MTQDETLKSSNDLTVPEEGELENSNGSTEPSEDNKDQSLPDGSKNWQHALQVKQERIKQLEAKVKANEEYEKQKKLADMDEVERLKLNLQEEQDKRASLELKLIIEDAVKGKNIPVAVLDVLKDTPWVFPAIKRNIVLGDTSADEMIDAVRDNINEVVETLEVKGESTPVEQRVSRKVDSERSSEGVVIKDRPLTLAEYKAIMEGSDELYLKNKARIADFIKQNGGVLPKE